MTYSIFKWFYMYAKCLHTSSYSKYSCAILSGLNTTDGVSHEHVTYVDDHLWLGC